MNELSRDRNHKERRERTSQNHCIESNYDGSLISYDTNKLEEALELMYGTIENKVEATKTILQMCKSVKNLSSFRDNHQMMSVLSRMLLDDASSSMQLCFNLGKIFLSFSNFAEFHEMLSSFRVGSLLMSVVELEVKRRKHRESTAINDKISKQMERADILGCRQDRVLFIVLKVLENLSDDVSVLRKMIKKGLVDSLCCLVEGKCRDCILVVLSLFGRCSIFEECCLKIIGPNSQTISKLVKFLTSAERNVVKSTLNFFCNASFNCKCRKSMMEGQVMTGLAHTMKKHSTRDISLRIIYNLTCDQIQRELVLSNGLSKSLTKLMSDNTSKLMSMELCAVAVNMSLVPACAQEMIKQLNYFVDIVRQHNNVLLSKVVRNLSIWSRAVWYESEKVQYTKTITSEFEESVIHDDKVDECKTLKKLNPWGRNVETLIAMSIGNEISDDVLVELLGTLGNMTKYDMPSGKCWSDMIKRYSLLDLILNVMTVDKTQNDLKLEAIILCCEICCDEECAGLLVSSNIIDATLVLWDYCYEEKDIMIQLLKFYERMSWFASSMNIFLLKPDLLKQILTCLHSKSTLLRLTTERCVSSIYLMNCSSQDSLQAISSSIVEERFLTSNNSWLQKNADLMSDISFENSEESDYESEDLVI